jgi:hypothetical protein
MRTKVATRARGRGGGLRQAVEIVINSTSEMSTTTMRMDRVMRSRERKRERKRRQVVGRVAVYYEKVASGGMHAVLR